MYNAIFVAVVVVAVVVAAAGFVPPLSEWRPPHWQHPLLLALLWMMCWLTAINNMLEIL